MLQGLSIKQLLIRISKKYQWRKHAFSQTMIGVLLGLSTISLIFAIFTMVLSQERLNAHSTIVNELSVSFNGNVRTLAMAQREILKLIILMESDDHDPEQLELQRSFVAQRMREATIEIQEITLGKTLFSQNLALVDQWKNDLNIRVLNYIEDAAISDVAKRNLIADLRNLELEFNYLTAQGEISRDKNSSELKKLADNILQDIVRIIVVLVFSITSFGLLSLVTSGVFREFARHRQDSTLKITNLQLETQKLSQVASLTSNLIVITDNTGLIEWANTAFLEKNYLHLEDIVGENITSLIHDATVLEMWAKNLTVQHGFSMESIAKTSQGNTYPVIIEVQASYDDEGLRNFIMMQTDISEIKQVEMALRSSEKQLKTALSKERELNQLKSQFVSMTSHEFRTPLTVISAASQTLFEFYERMTATQRFDRFQRINEQIDHMTSMLDDVLLINRIEEGQLTLNLERFSLTMFFREIVNEIKSTQYTHTLICECNVLNVDITADKKLVRQIFTNLVSNAIKYSPIGSYIYISLECNDQMAVLTVRDEGIGIPEDSQQDLFNSFHRASNVGNIKGTGLGLAITKRAVDMLCGQITFESHEGQGTTFSVQFPLDLVLESQAIS